MDVDFVAVGHLSVGAGVDGDTLRAELLGTSADQVGILYRRPP